MTYEAIHIGRHLGGPAIHGIAKAIFGHVGGDPLRHSSALGHIVISRRNIVILYFYEELILILLMYVK